MRPEEILNRVKNPNHIAGIYNYCDRWCERCAFTSRCLNCELSIENEKNLEKHDVDSKEFWDEMGKIYEGTMQLIRHIAEKEGIDLSKVDVEKDMQRTKDAEDRAGQHPISLMAKKYIDIKEGFYKNEKQLFVQRANEIKIQHEIGINAKKIKAETDEITDVLAIIGWYSPQIWVKMMRALTGKFNGEQWQDENGFPRDSDGSAKVALIEVDRSIGAWGQIGRAHV